MMLFIRMYSRHSHLRSYPSGFKSLFLYAHQSKWRCQKTSPFRWCAMRDLNPHGRPLEPKSSASANSANRAYIILSIRLKKRNQRFLSQTNGDPIGNRTRVTAVKGRCLNRLTMGPYKTGEDLLFQAASHQVSSAQKSLTTVFEMGTGVSSSLYSPD